MDAFQQRLNQYAELALRVGVNLQPGQYLVINAPVESADFVRAAARQAYEAGAREVHVEWIDDELTRIKYEGAPQETLAEYTHWRAQGFTEMAKKGAAFLYVSATNPDLLQGIDPERIATAGKTAASAMKEFSAYTRTGRVSWAIISVPGKAWSHKVFPGVTDEESVAKLWEAIFHATRLGAEDPVQAWQDHIRKLEEKRKVLNDRQLQKLVYRGPGTNLTIELPETHLWSGGGMKNEKGVFFVPNLPTEEVFTVPLKQGTQGTVRSTKPLNYAGNLIEDFTLTFENGRVTDVKAARGEEVLRKVLQTDEGASFLGEVALVPVKSPISESGILFYNTLYDENASCHLALGAALPFCIENGTTLNPGELAELGLNNSLIHIDFMIGSAELDIDGITRDGKTVPVFRQGNWAL
ncbi:aminopeptidase [Paenibacillus aurantius]|uniref:Aminopeptidase n=1 Tax=Paenibacillus aurantius TaxID=2918900 RepID=A0AA96LHR5_9BACL|nr:aminopeptidase [Paenibacillus aurantius]WNQ14349.1 aminopeptidase [Paenibacillus aurantius]